MRPVADPFILPLGAVLLGWMVAGGSPGPATLTISGTAMEHGRRAGLTVAAGIVCGSAIWGIAAGLGLSAVMVANAWVMEAVRIAGALYLLWLALKSARSAWRGTAVAQPRAAHRHLFAKGLLLHLTNPKAILSWGSIYAITLAPDAGPGAVWSLFALLSAGSMTVFFGYGALFALPPVARAYARTRRLFDTVFALLFGAASLKLLTLRLT